MTGPLTSEFSEDVVDLVELPEPEAADIILTEWDQIPGGAQRIVKLAQRMGYEVLVTYSRGPWQEVGSESYTIKQGIAVGGRRSDVPYNAAFRATWTSPNYPKAQEWSFNTAHIQGVPGLQSSVALTAYIDPVGALEKAKKKEAKHADQVHQ